MKIAYDILKGENDLQDYMSEKKCDCCDGYRLKKQSLAVKVGGKTISQILDFNIADCANFFADNPQQRQPPRQIYQLLDRYLR